jgi:hypothetical protein
MPRQARLDAPGTLHHVILRGLERRQIVADGDDRAAFVARLGVVAAATGTTLYAWALLPNHKGGRWCRNNLLHSPPRGLSRPQEAKGVAPQLSGDNLSAPWPGGKVPVAGMTVPIPGSSEGRRRAGPTSG